MTESKKKKSGMGSQDVCGVKNTTFYDTKNISQEFRETSFLNSQLILSPFFPLIASL